MSTDDGPVLVPENAESVPAPVTECALGIRPEHIEITGPGQGNFDAVISVVENTGSAFLAYAFLKNGQIVVSTSRRPDTGPAGLKFLPERVRFFT